MGIETPVAEGAGKVAGFFISPLGKLNLYITAGFFIILIILGLVQSVEQHSLYPLADNTVLKLVGADAQIGKAVDELESSARPTVSSGIWFKSFPSTVWFWLKFFFIIVSNLWFMWFFLYLLYSLFQMINSVSPLRSAVLAGISFAIISLIVGMILYNINLAGKCLSDDRMKNFNAQMANAYPFHGTIKLFSHLLNKDLFTKVVDWSHTSLGMAVTSIPVSPNITSNISMNNT